MFIRLATGQVVMGGDSRTSGRGFESRHRILDAHFSHYIVKNCIVCLKRAKINHKRGRRWPIFLKKHLFASAASIRPEMNAHADDDDEEEERRQWRRT